MNIYKPTWLYIKQHNIIGLKYFGKTTLKDPVKYKGSGLYWKYHLREHGNNVSTIWYQLFDSYESLYNYADKFSKENNIVESKEWANLIPENGLGGGGLKGRPGRKLTEEEKKKISEKLKGVGKGIPKPPRTIQHKENMSKSKKGHKYGPCSKERKEKIGLANRLPLETFIERSNLLHNSKYNYDNVVYVNAHTKIEIVCPIHGSWQQRPHDHLTGYGCPKCDIDKRRKK